MILVDLIYDAMIYEMILHDMIYKDMPTIQSPEKDPNSCQWMKATETGRYGLEIVRWL
jgi:hypothetical protein